MDFNRFKELINEEVTFPHVYTFKFVTKKQENHPLISLLEDHEIIIKESSAGKYMSVTSRREFHSADEIIEVYRKVSVVEGLITL